MTTKTVKQESNTTTKFGTAPVASATDRKTKMENLEKYRSKVYFFHKIKSLMSIPNYRILEQYPDEEFNNRLNKKIVEETLEFKFSDETVANLNRVCDISFTKDKRTPFEYALDLIVGWLMEDTLVAFLDDNEIHAKKIGVDAGRDFLTGAQINSTADLLIDGIECDVYFDSQGVWETENSMDVRETKWNYLKSNGGAIICISEAGFAIVETSKENPNVWENHRWGFKRAVSINDMRDRLINVYRFVKKIKTEL
jgi:hypothetical protein